MHTPLGPSIGNYRETPPHPWSEWSDPGKYVRCRYYATQSRRRTLYFLNDVMWSLRTCKIHAKAEKWKVRVLFMSVIMSSWCLRCELAGKKDYRAISVRPWNDCPRLTGKLKTKNEKEYKNLSGLLIKKSTRLLVGLANTQRTFNRRKIAEN